MTKLLNINDHLLSKGSDLELPQSCKIRKRAKPKLQLQHNFEFLLYNNFTTYKFFFQDLKMTISYTADVANASNFGVFTRILLRWKGSVYKLVYKELLAFLSLYFLLNIVYRNLLMTPGWEFYR